MTDDPIDRYLWEANGPAQEEVAVLERQLERYRHRAPAPAFGSQPSRRSQERVRTPFRAAFLLAAAAVALLVIRAQTNAHWRVLVAGDGKRFEAGDSLQSGNTRGLTLRIGDIGTVELDSSTSVALVRSGPLAHRLRLHRGRIRARTDAPPRLFAVETPLGVSTDLGCIFEMIVEPGGESIRVEQGLVAVDRGGITSLVPAGFTAELRPDLPAGVPVAVDGPEALREGIRGLATATARAERASLLDETLAAARPADLPTLWHLLARAPAGERARVHQRMAALRTPPAGIQERDVREGTDRLLDRWAGELGLADPRWWRTLRLTRLLAW